MSSRNDNVSISDVSAVARQLLAEGWNLTDFEALQVAVQFQGNQVNYEATQDIQGEGNTFNDIAMNINELCEKFDDLTAALTEKIAPAIIYAAQ